MCVPRRLIKFSHLAPCSEVSRGVGSKQFSSRVRLQPRDAEGIGTRGGETRGRSFGSVIKVGISEARRVEGMTERQCERVRKAVGKGR